MENYQEYVEKLHRELSGYSVGQTDFPFKVSVIIPCYDVEQYIEKCLNSVLKQTLREIEIICIDDGSTDSTPEIIRAYSEVDKRIKIIVQDHQKQGAARNAGMEIAKGEYIGFVDSDDWIDPDYYEKLYNAVKKCDSDVALADYIRIGNGRTKRRLNIDKEAVYTTIDEKFDICKQAKQPCPTNKIYKTEFLRHHNLIFPAGIYSEDKIFTCKAVYYANSVVSVPGTYYYYFRRPNSTVKIRSKIHSADKQCANQMVLDFLKEENVQLSGNDFWVVKKEYRMLGLCLYSIKESLKTEKHLLFGIIPFRETEKQRCTKDEQKSSLHNLIKKCLRSVFGHKQPVINQNTFIVWEPCSFSHGEVVPGYAKYLLDLGYSVSVLVHPGRLKEGLFERFKNENVFLNSMSRRQIEKYFKKNDLSEIKGILVTTVGKICDEIHFDDAYKTFNEKADKSKMFFVSHEAVYALDNGTWNKNLITLRKLNYKNGESVVVNPHYFGDVKVLPKNDITNFVTVGAIRSYRKNDNIIVKAAEELVARGITNFKVTVIGKGHIKNIPPKVRKYFDMKGRLSFRKMYDELEKADFLLTSYDVDNPAHLRYNTTGTSGNFQLVYGFCLPALIVDEFAPINRFTPQNAILYSKTDNYSEAMEKAIKMSQEEYKNMQDALKDTADEVYAESLENLRGLING